MKFEIDDKTGMIKTDQDGFVELANEKAELHVERDNLKQKLEKFKEFIDPSCPLEFTIDNFKKILACPNHPNSGKYDECEKLDS